MRIDDKLSTFDIKNVSSKSITKLINGLKDEAAKKEYIDNMYITDENIKDFLNKVLFVIDDKKPSDYVKAIIKKHPNIITDEQILNAIFNEIRNVQSSKKNTSVEGIVIQAPNDAINYCRHLTNNEIRMLALQRIITRNPVEKNNIPLSFLPICECWVPEKKKDMLDDCVQALCRALFNKTAAYEFWELFANIYNIIIKNPTYTVEEIYQSIDKNIRNASPDFDVNSLKYFIAHVKDGVINDN